MTDEELIANINEAARRLDEQGKPAFTYVTEDGCRKVDVSYSEFVKVDRPQRLLIFTENDLTNIEEIMDWLRFVRSCYSEELYCCEPGKDGSPGPYSDRVFFSHFNALGKALEC